MWVHGSCGWQALPSHSSDEQEHPHLFQLYDYWQNLIFIGKPTI